MLADLILHFNGIFATPKVKGISLPLLMEFQADICRGKL